MVERLYYADRALEFEATVTDVRLHSREGGGPDAQLWQVALDRTAFYPEGGGQPWDTGVLRATAKSGAILDCVVERVEEDEAGEVWHSVRKPLVAGTQVAGVVDAARRADHEQQHSGQHLVSAIFLREIGARTVSFHLGAESSTIDLALREGMDRLSEEDLLHVEEIVNDQVIAGRPMTARWVPRDTAVEMMERGELRKIPEREGPLRIIEMQGIEFNACGGTHVADTSRIGAVLLRKVEKVKQGWRVEFVCGGRAVKAARRDYELLSGSAGILSVGLHDVPSRVRKLVDEVKRSNKEREKLLTNVADAEASRLDEGFPPGALIEARYDNRDVHFARRILVGLVRKSRGALISVQEGTDGALFLLRPPNANFHAGEVIKAFLHDVSVDDSARGGGTADQAQILSLRFASVTRDQLAEVVRKLCDIGGVV